ncbi:Polyadenylate-binding protein 2 [Saguinus oedipus]|uniref:Polyadenylate-binding protein 2 n=1 Tax=Saguinus oedipus TaxID=9490 RepID=A0ABQ9U0T6_SAGOE|nr:Polyadenylate-binding protein 2 [Saguinus oedipus]
MDISSWTASTDFSANSPVPWSAMARPLRGQEEKELGLVEGDPGDGATEDPELEAVKARVREVEEAAEKPRELQNEVEKQVTVSPPAGGTGPWSCPLGRCRLPCLPSVLQCGLWCSEELEARSYGCGSVSHVTIPCAKCSGHHKGFAWIEFSDGQSVRTSLALDESLFRGRQIKVIPKRSNRAGIGTTDRGFPGARYHVRTRQLQQFPLSILQWF